MYSCWRAEISHKDWLAKGVKIWLLWAHALYCIACIMALAMCAVRNVYMCIVILVMLIYSFGMSPNSDKTIRIWRPTPQETWPDCRPCLVVLRLLPLDTPLLFCVESIHLINWTCPLTARHCYIMLHVFLCHYHAIPSSVFVSGNVHTCTLCIILHSLWSGQCMSMACGMCLVVWWSVEEVVKAVCVLPWNIACVRYIAWLCLHSIFNAAGVGMAGADYSSPTSWEKNVSSGTCFGQAESAFTTVELHDNSISIRICAIMHGQAS